MYKKKLISLLVLFALFLNEASVFAQCAMCRASASSDLEAGGSIAKGLNSGIYYLMAIPYLILALGGYFFFKKSVDAKIAELKSKLFNKQ